MSIASIELKYPNAIWFDSHYSGGGSDGSVDAPYTIIGNAMSAAADGGVIAIKDGNHNVTQIVMVKSLTFVGESTNAILTTSGTSYGGSFNARNTSHSIKLESLKVYHNSSSPTYGLITAGNTADATVTVDGCILEMGPLTLAVTNNRGWFSGSTPITSLTVSHSIILGGSGSSINGFVIGGDGFQKGFNAVNFQSNTFIVTGGVATKFSSYSTEITSSTFKNNIFIGNDNSETLGFTPLIYSYNCFNKCAVTTGGTNNLFNTDPQFVDAANGNFNLRPASPCINSQNNGRSAGIANILLKYPDAVWFDSHYSGGTPDGSVDAPYTVITDAQTAAGATKVIAVKNGTHLIPGGNAGKITTTIDLSLIGESTDAVISTTGNTYGGAINGNAPGISITLENIKIYHNNTAGCYMVIRTGTGGGSSFVATNCIFEMGPNSRASNNRGWFSAANNTRDCLLSLTGCTIIAGVNYSSTTDVPSSQNDGVVIGGSSGRSYDRIHIKSCTFRITSLTSNSIIKGTSAVGVSEFVFEDNIIYGFNNDMVLACAANNDPSFPFGGAGILSVKRNCYFKTWYSSTNAPPDTSGAVFDDPLFVENLNVSNYNFKLRPSSPCIASPTTAPTDAIYVFNGTQSLTADGSYENPYDMTSFYHSTAAVNRVAESAAGVNGTIIFKNGTYTPTASIQFQRLKAYYNGLTYKAETTGKVIFDYTGINDKTFTIGDTNTHQSYAGTAAGTGFVGKTYVRGIVFKDVARDTAGASLPDSAGYACVNILTDTDSWNPEANKIYFSDCSFDFHDIKADSDSSVIGSNGSQNFGISVNFTRCKFFFAGQTKSTFTTSFIGRRGNKQDIELNYCSVYFDKNFHFTHTSTYPTPAVFWIPHSAYTAFLSLKNSIFKISPESLSYSSGVHPMRLLYAWDWANMTVPAKYAAFNVVANGFRQGNASAGIQPYLTSDSTNKLSVDDPHFTDPDNNNLNLRPSSSFIGKGI